MILTSIPSWATPPESHPGSLKSHPQSQLIPLRFDWILMLRASYSPLYINLSILHACIHIWHSPFAALPQSERIFCASYSHLWPHTAYYHLTVTIATFYSYHFMLYLNSHLQKPSNPETGQKWKLSAHLRLPNIRPDRTKLNRTFKLEPIKESIGKIHLLWQGGGDCKGGFLISSLLCRIHIGLG